MSTIVNQPSETPQERTPLYGWVIVVVAALAMVATLPGRTHGLGMITERVLKDSTFGWDPEVERIEFSDANLLPTLIGGLFCLPCGWLIDRYGMRWMLTGTVLFLAAAVFWMTHARSAQELAWAILMTRGFGQSALSVISITMVGKWFPGRLSMPMAIYTLLLSFGFAMSSQVAGEWQDADWRVLWNGMGYCLLAFALVAVILTRDPPKYITLRESADPKAAVGFTVSQAIRTQTFWVFGIAISLIALVGSGQSLFNESILVGQGFPKQTYYDLLKFTFLASMVFKLPIGWLGQRVPLNQLHAAGLLLLAACQSILPSIHTRDGLTAYAVGMSISGAITTVLFFTIWGEAYGRKHLGKIQGLAQMMTVVASALGPRVFAECYTRNENYDLALIVPGGIAAFLAVWSLLIRVPRPEDAPLSQPLSGSSPLLQES